MAQFYKGADSILIGWNLILFSLDAVVPAYDLIRAPTMTGSDLDDLRNWILRGPPLNCFAFGNDHDFDAYAADLRGSLAEGRGTALLDWAAMTTSLVDWSPGTERIHWPSYAFAAWIEALDDAASLGLIAQLSIDAAQIKVLSDLIEQRQVRQAAAEAFTQTVRKEWDPYPRDPGQLAYNRNAKSPWDRKIYDEFCRENSTSLDFGILFMIDHQEARNFVKHYATQLSSSDHTTIRLELPRLLDGKGQFATDPHRTERLVRFAEYPPETLLPFA